MSLYRLALTGLSFLRFMVLSLGTGMRPLAFLYIFPYTTKTSANCFSVAGINGRIIYCFTR